MKKKSIHLLIPMSGQGTRYMKAGYKDPKPMIPVNGIPMIERLLSKIPFDWGCTFVLAENHRQSGLPELLSKLRPHGQILFVPPHQVGPSYPLQESLTTLPSDASILVSYCDYGLVWDAHQFQEFVSYTDCDACLLSYKGFHAHYLSPTPYAYSKLHGEKVVQVKEKGSFTENREQEYASCGAYYFKNKNLLEEALKYQLAKDIKVNGEFYTSLTVEALLQAKPEAHVRVFEIPYFFQWGTPDDLKDFEYWERAYQAKNKFLSQKLSVEQVFIPMAGLGSRFSKITEQKKPFITICGDRMYEKALDSLPKADKTAIVTLKEYQKLVNSAYSFKGLSETPPGQALTVEEGLSLLDDNQSVLISACDHGVVIDPEKWKAFQEQDCDAAVFCIKGFPGVRRSPQSYSFVECQRSEDKFPIVKTIMIKQTVTSNPLQDNLLVGTFWFKNKTILAKGLQKIKEKSQKVNNELYLDGIFNELNELGYMTVVFPLDGYFNWGDPESLKESLYWEEVFSGHTLSPRKAFSGVEEIDV